MPRRSILTVLVICGVLGAVRTGTAQVNSFLNVRNLPSPCTSATPGELDSWSSFNCAVGLLPLDGGEIYVPAGTYYLSQAVNVTDRNVMFRGEGRRISTLVWNSGFSNGLSFSSTSDAQNYIFGVRHLSLLKGQYDGRAAIRGQWKPCTSDAGHRHHGVVTTTIHDVQIGPVNWADPGGVSWTFGIELVDSTAAFINQFDIHGEGADNGIAAAIQIGGGEPPVADDSKSLGIQIRDGRITRYERGIETRNNAEGVHIQYVSMHEVGYGIQMTNGTGTALTNNRIFARSRGVELTETRHVAISHNRIEQFSDAEFIGIRVMGMDGARVTGNSITSPGTGVQPRNGIVVEGAATVSVIQQNTTENMNTGIWLVGPSVQNAMVVGNINRGWTAFAVLNNGLNAYVQSNH